MPRHTRTPSAWYLPYQGDNTLIRQYGGLHCGTDGTISKPFPNKPYCVEGAGTFVAVNECSKQVSICQTVLPGNEAMLIPNSVPAGGDLTLAVPDPSYWCSTSAEFYVNIPGYNTDTACVWGDGSAPYGNWSPFVAGANQAANGDTFVMVGINPIYCCQSNPWPNQDPGFAVRIECPSGNCNGLPCECNPSTMGPNKCTGGTVGAGGAEFCLVTVPAGDTANLVIFSTSGKSGSSHNDRCSCKCRFFQWRWCKCCPSSPSSPESPGSCVKRQLLYHIDERILYEIDFEYLGFCSRIVCTCASRLPIRRRFAGISTSALSSPE